MDQVLEDTGKGYRIGFDHTKDWKNHKYLGVTLASERHRKYRTAKANAAFAIVRRLSRLPPKEQETLIVR